MKYYIETDDNFDKILHQEFLKRQDLPGILFDNPDFRDFLTNYRFKNILNEQFSYLDSEKSSTVTIAHNTDPSRMFYSEMSRRPDLITLPLRCLNSVGQNAHRLRVATVGCRTEAEIFSLVNAGFNPDNIDGFDLFTNSPYIKLGDVTNLSISDGHYDISICGWVFEFVTDLQSAASELIRITKNGGIIAIGGMHHPISMNLEEYARRKNHQDREWFCSVEKIKALFDIKDKDILFKSDIEDEDLDKRGDVVLIFKVRK